MYYTTVHGTHKLVFRGTWARCKYFG